MANCGGNWNNSGKAGVFYVNLNNTRTNTNSNIGFRSALLSLCWRPSEHSSVDVREIKGVCFHTDLIKRGEKGRRVRVCVVVWAETNKTRTTLEDRK